ncbi:MAG: methylenetetrahydrofolate reductase C-terminal domain-containing protein [Dehalococcoidia bacterium]|nr:methylenetetrahydrofolate reductase C-terminal domain-containing protein [Dehalococcoidia bacterium]
MYTITKQKQDAEISDSLAGLESIFIIGCGTCATACHTGGKAEVLETRKKLEQLGKKVVGWMVIPTPCDSLTRVALEEDAERLKQADAVLVMACAYGVQNVASFAENVVIPALDTLFFGMENAAVPGQFAEVCLQCGECVLAQTGGMCPVTICPKGLVNGPCGGTRDGKCEVDPTKDCAWTLIYNRLKKQGRLDQMRKTQKPKNYQPMTHPRRASVSC